MFPYWLLFAVPAFVSLFESPRHTFKGERVLFVLAIALIAVMVGLRYEVGGDWSAYLDYLDSAYSLQLEEIPQASDPGYVLLNWVVSRLGGDVWLVNLACGGLFALGLLQFARAQPSPWLALVAAVPYLIVVVAMGYSRQAVAIGLAMLGLTALMRSQSTVRFVAWMLLAATFHKTAVLLIPIGALTVDRGRVWVAFWVVAATAVGYFVLLEDSVGGLISGYIDANYQSDGAAIRVAMNAAPAVFLLLLRRQLPISSTEMRLLVILSGLSLLFVPALFLVPSTAVDRLALYMIPLQLVVLSRLPIALANSERTLRLMSFGVVLYAAVVLFVWLNYAKHAQYWLPYQLYPL